MKSFFLVTTDHLEEGVWFRDDEDFAVGMNLVAVMVSSSGVVVLAFILMSNHVHFVLYCEEDEAEAFINGLKGLYSRYLRTKYGFKEFLRGNKVRVQHIPEETEALERVIAYVQMNSVAASICSHATQYPWGTGNAFFNPSAHAGRRLDELSKRARIKLFHSHTVDLPGAWRISEAGYILPESYVDVDFVERLFRRPERMTYFLNSSSKAKKRLDAAEDRLPAFRDQVILNALPDLCRSLFQKNGLGELSAGERAELMRQIRFRFSSNVNQIARICGLSYAEAARLLDGV